MPDHAPGGGDPAERAAAEGFMGSLGRRRPLRRTPCVGVCSTTYGDLVCRGCKRFAHEIVGWNGYQEGQRELVWARLNGLLADSVRTVLVVVDEDRLRRIGGRLTIADAEVMPAEILAFQVLRVRPLPLDELGLEARRAGVSSRDVGRQIDTEFYARSRAHYEASFKTLT